MANNTYADADGKPTAEGYAELMRWWHRYDGCPERVIKGHPRFGRMHTLMLEMVAEGRVDIVEVRQDILAYAAGRLADFDPERGVTLDTFVGWAVVFVVSHTLRRAKQRVDTVSLDAPIEHQTRRGAVTISTLVPDTSARDPGEMADTAITPFGTLTGAVGRLPAPQRRVLDMLYVRNLTAEEAAAEVGVSRKRIYQVLKDAIARLGDKPRAKTQRRPGKRKSYATGKQCAHCGVRKSIRAKGLCHPCSLDPAIRGQYRAATPVQRFANRGAW